MVQLNFDPQSVRPMMEREAIPAGWYNVMVEKEEAQPTKDGQGAFLKLQFTVLDGAYKDAKLFTRLNIRNANPVAVEIAYSELRSICEAVNIRSLADSAMLLNIPLKVKVKVRKDPTGQYEDQNEITSYRSINHQVPVNTIAAPVQQAAPAQQAWQAPQTAQQPWQAAQPAFNQQAPQPDWANQQAPQTAQPNPAQPVQQAPQVAGAMPPWLAH